MNVVLEEAIMSITGRSYAKQTMTIPSVLLRLEGLTVFIGMIALYAYWGFNWWTFGLCLLTPDIAIAAYLINKEVGAGAYNLVHSYIMPLVLAVVCLIVDIPVGLQLALIWVAHIAMDRSIGYGLKYTSDFKDTHLGRV
jgi:hypothetical protein